MLGQAGTTPRALTRPGVGLRPTMLLKAAGMRPDPAVSVPSAKGTSPRETATADPELEPPLMRSVANVLLGRPYGERVPTRPVANWSRLVLPTQTAPASTRRATAPAWRTAS